MRMQERGMDLPSADFKLGQLLLSCACGFDFRWELRSLGCLSWRAALRHIHYASATASRFQAHQPYNFTTLIPALYGQPHLGLCAKDLRGIVFSSEVFIDRILESNKAFWRSYARTQRRKKPCFRLAQLESWLDISPFALLDNVLPTGHISDMLYLVQRMD